jgi:putative component of toxin-antitoxin plasmid stabilization module
LPTYIGKWGCGYRITKHPACSSWTFADKLKSPEENLADAVDALNQLNCGQIVHEAPVRETPEHIQKSGDGYRVYYKRRTDDRIATKVCRQGPTQLDSLNEAKSALDMFILEDEIDGMPLLEDD